MSYRKNIIYAFAFFYMLISGGCATSYAPLDYLPETTEVPQNPYGGWITIITEPDSLLPDDKWMMYSGEFISEEENLVYLLYDSIYLIPKYKISESILELDKKNTTTYGIWVLAGSLLTISNGYYGTITLPLWLAFGIPTASGESFRDIYEIEYPTEEYWDSIKVFSRFPQGVENIDLNKIKPYIPTEE